MAEVTRRLLVVEDEPLFAELLAKSLLENNFEVKTVSDAAQARKALVSFDPDIALLDITLGDGPSGIHLAHIIHETRPDIAILILTKHANARTATEEGLELPPGVGFIRKHMVNNTSHLLEAIERVLSDRPNEVRNEELTLSPIERLNPQALKVLALLSKGYNNSEIALRMNLSVKSIERWIESIYKELDIKSDRSINPRVEAARQYYLVSGISKRQLEE
jgi:DNA-binding NarL/FixJ family response regulator